MAVIALRGSDPPRGDLAVSLRLTHLLMVEAVVSGEGLARVSEIASAAMGDAAVVVCVPRDGIADGAPRMTTAPLLSDLLDYAARGAQAAERPHHLTLEEPIVSGGEVIGFVGIVGAVASALRDDARRFLHLVAMAALIDIAIEEVGSEDEVNACGAFFTDLRSGRALGREEVVQRAGRLKCDLTTGVAVLCAELTTRRPRHVVALITGDHPGALVDLVDGRLFAILPLRPGGRPRTTHLPRRVASARRSSATGAWRCRASIPTPSTSRGRCWKRSWCSSSHAIKSPGRPVTTATTGRARADWHRTREWCAPSTSRPWQRWRLTTSATAATCCGRSPPT